MYDLVRIEGEEILERYLEIKVEVDKALEFSNGEWTPAQIITNAITDPSMFHIWEISVMGSPVAIATTRINIYPNFQSMHVITLGGTARGNFGEWAELLEEEVKKNPHITVLEYCGRRGFAKGLEKVGWKEQYSTMRKFIGEV